MRIGIDFDNTVVCYDTLFHDLACECNLVSPSLPRTKQAVRNYLRSNGQEDIWIELQGIAYGPRMKDATASIGALDGIRELLNKGFKLAIISHKTKYPYAGSGYDLHAAAEAWLNSNGFQSGGLLEKVEIYFETTKASKLDRIGNFSCNYFIDDLPEFLGDPQFPSKVGKILFDPNRANKRSSAYQVMTNWRQASSLIRSRNLVNANDI